jgi:hypothetical protein
MFVGPLFPRFLVRQANGSERQSNLAALHVDQRSCQAAGTTLHAVLDFFF